MNPAHKALWFIESHLADALTLDEISGVAGISRFHMVRAFAAATGFSVMRYVRARRLTEAARALANGAPDILSLALDADYGSHEAFTRAFREHFGVTPEMVRATTCLEKLQLQEPIVMDSTAAGQTSTAAFRNRQGLARRRHRRALLLRKQRGHSRPVAAFPPVGRSYSRPDRQGGLRRLLQRRRRRKLRLYRRRRSVGLFRPAA